MLQHQYLQKTLGQASQKEKDSSLSLPFFSQQPLGFLQVPISQETWRYVVFSVIVVLGDGGAVGGQHKELQRSIVTVFLYSFQTITFL